MNSYTSQDVLIKHKGKCGKDEICAIRTSSESNPNWKKHFYRNPLYFRIYADFEADNEIENCRIGNKTTNIYKQNPICNGYEILSELEDVLKSDYNKSPLGYETVHWFVDEIINLENKINFCLRILRKIS